MRIVNEELRRWLGLVLGAGALGIGIATISHQAMAQGTQPRRGDDARPGAERPGAPRGEGEGGGFGGRFGGGGFGGPMGPGMMGMMGGGATLTANQSTVFVLRGNRLFAYDANNLRLRAQAEIPMPQPRGEGGFGGGGHGGFGGRPERERENNE